MISGQLLALPTKARAAQHERSRHTCPGFVSSHRAATHLHASNNLLRAIMGPGHVRLPVEDPVIGPMFAKTDEQQAQLIQGRQGLIPPGSALWDLLPEFEQTSTTFQGQLGDQEFDFIDHPQPIFGDSDTQLLQRATDPSAHMELADLVFYIQLFRHSFVMHQVVSDNDAHSQAFDQWFQPAPDCLGVVFVHKPTASGSPLPKSTATNTGRTSPQART